MIAFYLIHVAGLLYTKDLVSGLKELEKLIILAILPILLGSLAVYNQIVRKQVLLFFAFAVIFTASLYLFISTDTLDEILTITRTYLGLYLLFSLAILLGYAFLDNVSWRETTLFSLLILFNIFLLARTASKISIFLFGPLLLLFLLFHVQQKGVRLLPLAFFFVGIAIMAFFATKNEFTANRLQKFFNEKGDFIRYRNWETNIEVIKQSPIFGHGTGSVLDVLQRQRDREWHEYVSQYNSHNQYLETTVQLGAVGLIGLLACFFVQLRHSFKNKDFVYSAMILIFVLSCSTESLLERRKGVFFFSFFSCFLFMTPGKTEQPDTKQIKIS